MSINIDDLQKALENARQAALKADPGDDGGTCNLDSVVIVLPYFSVKSAEPLGLTKRHGRQPGRFWVDVGARGQAARRTAMVEAAVKSLRNSGYDAFVHYHMD